MTLSKGRGRVRSTWQPIETAGDRDAAQDVIRCRQRWKRISDEFI